MKQIIFYTPIMKKIANNFCKLNEKNFSIHEINWKKFDDDTDNIFIEGLCNKNYIKNKNVIFFSSFHNNDVFLSQLNAIMIILSNLPSSFKMILPYYSVGTNEKILKEGEVPTSYTTAHILSNLPKITSPIEIITFDIHTLQNKFFFNNNSVLINLSFIPYIKKIMDDMYIKNIVFPDYGAFKRFGHIFDEKKYNIYTCNKIRNDDGTRKISFNYDNTINGDIFLIDDLVQSGNTLIETGKEIKNKINGKINIFVVHAVFPKESWKKFINGSNNNIFEKMYISNTNPNISQTLKNIDFFEILNFENILYENII
jgi:phosphoribosylpyrophosphate synthetase